MMPGFDPELLRTMRLALEDFMAHLPAEAATPAIKAAVAERICKAAAQGVSTYDGFILAASDQIQALIAWLL
jgi:hypothetical protein